MLKKIVLTGGGTAGHVTPNLALIPRLKADGWEIHYIGAANSAEETLISQVEGVRFYAVSVGKLRRYFDLKNFSDPFRVIRGVGQATRIIHKIKPNVVFSKGGFVSVPVVYGAKLNGVPVVSHESDMTPGLANKLCLPFTMVQCCTFPEAVKYARGKGVHTGSPIRPEILRGSKEGGLKRFGLNHSRPVLMVMGGSSGAQAINQVVWQCLPKLTENFQVLHLCGRGNLSPALEGTDNYTQVEYLNDDREMGRLRLRRHTGLPRRQQFAVRDPGRAQAGAADSLSQGCQPGRPDPERRILPGPGLQPRAAAGGHDPGNLDQGHRDALSRPRRPLRDHGHRAHRQRHRQCTRANLQIRQIKSANALFI